MNARATQRTAACLVGITGLPGTGKSALARALAKSLGFALIGTDQVSGAIRRVDPESYPQRAARLAGPIAGSIAAQQFALGLGVVLDHAGHRNSVRADWARFAQRHRVPFVLLHTVCSDVGEHRRRVEADRAIAPGMPKRTWADVEAQRAKFEQWEAAQLVLDAMQSPADNLRAALAYVRREAGAATT
jgi:predicted kinase